MTHCHNLLNMSISFKVDYAIFITKTHLNIENISISSFTQLTDNW